MVGGVQVKQPLFSSAVCLTNLNPGDVLLMCSKVEQDVSRDADYGHAGMPRMPAYLTTTL